MYSHTINQLRRLARVVTRGTAVLAMALVLVAGTVASNHAEAKRIGGGSSVGRQSQTASPSGQGQRSQQAQPAQQAAPAAAAAKPANRWMGPLAGLAAGLGIAALMSSLGLGEGLAQMLSNVVVIGLVIVAGIMLFRFIANRRRPDLAYGHDAANGQRMNGSWLMNQSGQAAPETNFGAWPRTAMNPAAAAQTTTVPGLPVGLDQAVLLASARTLFLRLQCAWDQNEQGDLFELTTPEMFAVIKRDLEDRGNQPSHTEITQLDVQLLSTEHNGSETLVSLRFHGQMREDEDAQTAQPFEEVWNIVGHGHGDPAWRLAGIQQIGR
ncbi:Tim44 domain-containing protein [Paraburkholderia sp. UCT2]|uniref:Tim44 domain-containing protein n=1 Tax=Paraburkholderia sp. UCT2 TaxID=2615208 RepID=UPI0016561500|nr:TIM44-like domain-containing protein [Paraburkholderia sp. UCT2]MBC8729589.1 Tim44 domain-containing protein [Paraburkholderia sp. UCT2]